MNYEKQIAKKQARQEELFKQKALIDAELRRLSKQVGVLKDKRAKQELKKEKTLVTVITAGLR